MDTEISQDTSPATVTTTLTYRLSEAGQRDELLAGRPAHAERSVEVAIPVAEILAWPGARVYDDGSIHPEEWNIQQTISRAAGWRIISTDSRSGRLTRPAIDRSGSWSVGFIRQDSVDAPLTPEAALEYWRARVAALAESEMAAEAERVRLERDELPVAIAAWEEAEAKRLAAQEAARTRALELAQLYLAGDPEVSFREDSHGEYIRVGKEIIETFQSGILGGDLRARVIDQRDRRRAAAKAIELASVAAWAREHGSERLRLCIEAGMIENCLGVYRDERLAFERPGWEWDEDEKEVSITNPSEAELRAYLDARASDPEVRLVSSGHKSSCDRHDDNYRDGCDDCTVLWRHALASELLGRGIIRYFTR